MTRPTTRSLWEGIRARKHADFLVLPDARLSYAAIERAVRRWLSEFDRLGLAPGDRVLIRTTQEAGTISCLAAALLDGLVPVPLSPDSPDGRTLNLLEAVEAAALVIDDGNETDWLPAGVKRVALGRPGPRRWFGSVPDPLPGLEGKPATREPRLPDDPEGLAYILFTSGTTSSPSGVMITQVNLFAQMETLSRLFGYGESSRIFNDMVLGHADGLVQGPMLALANGCALIRSGGFRLDAIEPWLDRVRRERATHVITVPTVWAMIDAYAAHDDYFDAPECRALLSVAARLPDELWRRLEDRFARPMFSQYGLTETVTSTLYAGPAPEMGSFGTMGRPVDCEARIDPEAKDPGEGELQLRGENIFPGYWKNPDRTQATFTDDGWMKTGDLARLRSDGSYEMLGRSKSVIKMGGLLIRPDEIDEAMLRHSHVRESVTVGIRDEIFGELPVTAVVCSGSIDANAIVAHARAHLEPQKVPKRIVELEAIPRGDSGKPRLSELHDMLAGLLESAPAAVQANGGLADEVKNVAAEVFCIEAAKLAESTGPGDIPGWDSFSQLNFVLAIEQRFGIVIPASRVAAIRTIDDMARTVGDLST
jgi:long-chain acyl-CoA synthetase